MWLPQREVPYGRARMSEVRRPWWCGSGCASARVWCGRVVGRIRYGIFYQHACLSLWSCLPDSSHECGHIHGSEVSVGVGLALQQECGADVCVTSSASYFLEYISLARTYWFATPTLKLNIRQFPSFGGTPWLQKLKIKNPLIVQGQFQNFKF